MPDPDAPTSIGKQLAAALLETGVSQRELARRLALIDNDGATWESKRRWLSKLISDEVERPQLESLLEISQALGLPDDYFQPAPPAEPASIRRRLESLGETVGQILENQEEQLGLLRRLVSALADETPVPARTATRAAPRRRQGVES